MDLLRGIKRLFAVEADNPELIRAQLEALTRQIPLLYLILIINSIAVATTHLGLAPDAMTIAFPTIFCFASLIRLAYWHYTRHREIGHDEAVSMLRSTVRLSAAIGGAVTFWGINLFRYGGPYQQAQVAFYMAITVVACVFCLMYLRAAALAVTLIVVVPFSVFFLCSENPVFVAIALNLLLVSVAMVVVLLSHYDSFAKRIATQKELIAKQAETQRLSDENFRLANIDSLTSMPNRRRFFAELDTIFNKARLANGRFAVGLIDLDGFKAVNDLYGHSTGDRLLIEACERLRSHLPVDVFLARLGGDEFGLVVEGIESREKLMEFGSSFCAILSAPYSLGTSTAEVSASTGFAVYPDSAASVEALLEHADYALYHAKSSARGMPVVFSQDHKTEMHKLSVLEQRLRQADLAAELWIAYQPVIDTRTGHAVSFEALARWTSPVLGAVPPDLFIRAAERSDLVNRITEMLLRKALQEAKGWRSDLRISFNLSARNLMSTETMLRLMAIIGESGVNPGRIDFEITETVLMADFENARDRLQMLRRIGVGISLDDFGSGYSSLSYVHQLQLDKIKIDRTFINDIDTEARSRNVIKSVLDLCRNLNLICVVEGVENARQFATISKLGCDMVQGFFVAQPMPPGEISQFLLEEEQRLASSVRAISA